MDFDRKSERIEHLNPEGDESRILMDLSATGACCLYDREKEKGTFILLRVADYDLKAKVIYCQHREGAYRLGLQFWNLSDQSVRKVKELVDKYSKGVPLECEVVEEKGGSEGED